MSKKTRKRATKIPKRPTRGKLAKGVQASRDDASLDKRSTDACECDGGQPGRAAGPYDSLKWTEWPVSEDAFPLERQFHAARLLLSDGTAKPIPIGPCGLLIDAPRKAVEALLVSDCKSTRSAGDVKDEELDRHVLCFVGQAEATIRERFLRILGEDARRWAAVFAQLCAWPGTGTPWNELARYIGFLIPDQPIGSLIPLPRGWTAPLPRGPIVDAIRLVDPGVSDHDIGNFRDPDFDSEKCIGLAWVVMTLVESRQVHISTFQPLVKGWGGPVFRLSVPPAGPRPARHSPDFRSVHWFGTDYAFTATQAAIVKLLWEAWENGTQDVGGDYLTVTAAVADSQRMRDVFRGQPAWGSLIVEGASKGTYRLAPPQNN